MASQSTMHFISRKGVVGRNGEQNSIVGNRNKIAHGDSVTLSLNSLRAYYKDATKAIAAIEKVCGL